MARHGEAAEDAGPGRRGGGRGRYPAGLLLWAPPARRCFVNDLDLWSDDAVLERPADAVARLDAVLTVLRWRMPKPRRWGAVVMRHAPHHP